LREYLKEIELPDKTIEPAGEISSSFLMSHILTLWDAIEYVSKLAYGRTTNRENYLQVLNEKKGACSTKHALIAALAEEQYIPLELTLGIILLDANNMPAITHVLDAFQLDSIPEAHCYLMYKYRTLDITFPDVLDFSLKAVVKEEEKITPKKIGSYKVKKHQYFIKEWLKDKAALNCDLIWSAREKIIHELDLRN
jgi:hypothetical protein